ncbi:MAG: FeoB-associated Cys-rich membrane protein [Candidatus Faecousia sp.]|nr:FeoB-associated Cys-rich membrane protein [Candidatus Faecousia sp.]
MLQWMIANLGTIIICIVLLTGIFFIVRFLIRQKKQGKSACGCGCANCAMRGSCHSR